MQGEKNYIEDICITYEVLLLPKDVLYFILQYETSLRSMWSTVELQPCLEVPDIVLNTTEGGSREGRTSVVVPSGGTDSNNLGTFD